MKNFIVRAPTEIGSFQVTGISRAGIGTSLTLPSLGICFDVANGVESAWNARLHLITHGHMDHAAGIPYIISQRALHQLPPARFLMPEAMIEPMTKIMDQWSKIEGFTYHYDFQIARPGETHHVDAKWGVVPFSTVHRVPSVGYSLIEVRKKLKAEFQATEPAQLTRLAQSGVELTEPVRKARIAFTGDTQIEVIAQSALLRQSEIVFIEVTYFGSGSGSGSGKTVENARAWGHIHFDEILEHLSELDQVRHLVFIHPSRRHTLEEINGILNQRLPTEWHERVSVFS